MIKHVTRITVNFLIFSVLTAGFVHPFLNPLRNFTKKGNQAFTKEDYTRALEFYNSALGENPLSSEVLFNLANTFSARGQYDKAITNYEKALPHAGKDLQEKIYFNQGNVFFKNQQYDESVKSFINALKINKDNQKTKFNLEIARKKLREHSSKEQRNQNQKADEKETGSKKNDKNQSRDQDKKDQGNKQKENNKNQDENNQNQQNQDNQQDGEKKTAPSAQDKEKQD